MWQNKLSEGLAKGTEALKEGTEKLTESLKNIGKNISPSDLVKVFKEAGITKTLDDFKKEMGTKLGSGEDSNMTLHEFKGASNPEIFRDPPRLRDKPLIFGDSGKLEIQLPDKPLTLKDSPLENGKDLDFSTLDSVLPGKDNFVPADKETQKEIKEKSPFSEAINKFIRKVEELLIYMELGLKEAIVNDKPCLIRDDIDLYQKDDSEPEPLTNLERMKLGKAPLDKNGKSIVLHHIGQSPDSPLAELTSDEHNKYSGTLHQSQKSEIDRIKFDKEREAYWKARAAQIEAQLAKN